MSILDSAYQNYLNENYEPGEDSDSMDEEMAEMQSEYESNQSIEKCSECSAEIKIYVGYDSEELDWNEVIREPKDEREKKLFELDPLSFYDREYFIKPESLICAQCKTKQSENPDADDDILF